MTAATPKAARRHGWASALALLLGVVLLHGAAGEWHAALAQDPPAPAQPEAQAAQPDAQPAPPEGQAAQSAPPQPAPASQWERVFYGQWEGAEALLYNSSIFFGKLALGDLDADGDPDLLVGKQDGRIDRFENVGTVGEPRWRLVQENLTVLVPRAEGDTGAAMAVLTTNGHAAPALVDIDQDDDLDLFVGTGDGRLLFFRNVGNRVLPAFSLVTANFLGPGFGMDIVPAFSDVDGNRSPDLVVGNRAGDVYLLPNQGTQRRAAYCVQFPPRDALPDEEPPCRPAPRRLFSIAPESNAAPGLVDWDGDGDPDLFVGKSNGTISYYQNLGTAVAAEWRLTQERFLAIDDGGFAAPAFVEANGDGRPDLLIGSSTNSVSLYTNKDTASVLDVWKTTGNALAIRRIGLDLRQIVIASGDLDGDGDPDLLVGDRGGRLIWLENVGSAQGPAWRVKSPHMAPGTLRENLAPTLLDLDGDGDLDLLVGGADGRFWLMRNVGSAKEARFSLETTSYAGMDVGNDSIAAATDIDGDGDLDLLVGNRRGLVILYRNEGTAAAPDFQLRSTRFGGISVPLAAAPAPFDWNGDGKPDLVVGSRRGRLVLDVNGNAAGATELDQWKIEADPWASFLVAGYSTPHFTDLNGDGRPDLLIGDADGNLQLWYNRTPRAAATTAQAAAAEGGAPPATGGPAAALAATAAPAQRSFESQSGLSALVESGQAGAPGTASATEILLSEPQGLSALPPIFTLATDKLGELSFKGRIRPAVGDLDGDDLVDLVIGTADGKLVYYRNSGTANEPKWEQAAENLGSFEGGGNPAPVLADLDGDGLLDLIVGTEGGLLQFFRNTGQKNAPKFTRDEQALAGINVGRNAAPAVGFVDNNDTTDLIVGDFSGHLWAFAREGGAQSLNFKLVDRRYLGVDVGVAATPFVGDIDRDGKQDLLVGSDQGRMSVFRRVGVDGKNPYGWAASAEVLEGIKFPFGTSPRLADIDGDGDADLLTGSENGTLYLYRNDAFSIQPDAAR